METLKQDLERANARAEGASLAHESLRTELADLTDTVAKARDKRRTADHALAEANRALSRAEADLLIGALPSLSMSSDRAALLLALATRASTERVREAAAELPSDGRARVLDALLRRQQR